MAKVAIRVAWLSLRRVVTKLVIANFLPDRTSAIHRWSPWHARGRVKVRVDTPLYPDLLEFELNRLARKQCTLILNS